MEGMISRQGRPSENEQWIPTTRLNAGATISEQFDESSMLRND
jgi:hypothetical protein